jgi:hypothetical protein
MNDPDAAFCSECGKPMARESNPTPGKMKKPYFYALLLVPVIVLAAAVGYYKFFLPQGIAAVVNGEEIRLSELDGELVRVQGSGKPADGRLRHQLLNAMIAERLALQEARKADMTVSPEELESIVGEMRSASGMSEAGFNQWIEEQYGDRQVYLQALSRRVLMNKYITERVVPSGADPRQARQITNEWMQRLYAAAAVRITLAEQWSGAGCGCCANGGNAGNRGVAFASEKTGRPSAADRASDAALRYWQEKHGAEKVTARVKDFGCHMEIDIIKDEKVIGSLQYQGGRISER